MRGLGVGGVAAVAAALLVVPARAAAPAPCDALAMSPAFDRDGTAFCVALRKPRIDQPATGVDVFRTTDRGRSWHRRAGAGLPSETAGWSQAVVASDGSWYAHGLETGLYRSTDAGGTFVLVDPTARPNAFLPSIATTADAPPPVPPGAARSGVLHANRLSSLFHAPVRRPVPGPAAGVAVSFLVPARGPAIAVAQVQEVGARFAFSTCTATYACAPEFFTLPVGWRVLGADLVGAAGRERLVVVGRAALGPDTGKVAAWRSGDALTGMQPYPELERVLAPFGSDVESVSLAATPRGVVAGVRQSATNRLPSRHLFAADAAGNRWRAVSYGRWVTERGPRGTLPPSNLYAAAFNESRTWVARDRLFTLGTYGVDGVSAVFCSRDGGRTWRPAC